MNDSTATPRASRRFLWMLALLIGIAVIVTAYAALGPGPTDFAGGPRASIGATGAGPDPTGVPAELRSASLIERGEYLTRAADCRVCHTARDGTPFAGGRPFVLQFGTVYSTNITPDAATGIGRYSDADFLAALHRGLRRDHARLYPAMPYPSYTYMSDGDALAIKAYLFSLKPAHAPAAVNTLWFPFNQRALMDIWAWLFNPNQRFAVRTQRNAEWNRGAYLVEALGHCGECHTGRNLFLALNNRRKFAGEVQSGWRAYNITADAASGVGNWSDADLRQYLSVGHADGRGTAAGPMGEAIDESLSRLRPSDISAIVTYLRTVPAIATADLRPPRDAAAPTAPQAEAAADMHAGGKAVYAGACAGCHGWSGLAPAQPYAALIGARAVNDPTATNVVQVILSGGHRHYASDSANMPAFGTTYSDDEVAELANYVTARFGTQVSGLTAAKVAELRRRD